MKKYIIAVFIVSIIVSCDQPKELNKDKSEMDSLIIQKSTKQVEVKQLKNELDSLKNIRDSLVKISK